MERPDALNALAALSQGTRLDVFRLLVRQTPNGLAAGEIADRLGVVQNTMSSHLGVLARAGLVEAARDGRSVRYSANLAGMCGLLTFLMEDCCQGAPEICASLMDIISCR